MTDQNVKGKERGEQRREDIFLLSFSWHMILPSSFWHNHSDLGKKGLAATKLMLICKTVQYTKSVQFIKNYASFGQQKICKLLTDYCYSGFVYKVMNRDELQLFYWDGLVPNVAMSLPFNTKMN